MLRALYTAATGMQAQQINIDTIANNIANVNTTGYKADKSMFEEYLMPTAHEDNFVGRDRRLSFVQDRATYRDLSNGPMEQTTLTSWPSPSICSSWQSRSNHSVHEFSDGRPSWPT